MSLAILAECQADTLLSRKLLVPALNLVNADVDRSCNIGEVSNRLTKYYSNRRAIGIIDKDKNVGRLFKTFETYPGHEYFSIVHKWNGDKHHLLYFQNGLEHFLNEAANQSGIDRAAFSQLQTIEQIRSHTKTIQVDTDSMFLNFLNIIRNNNPANFRTFVDWAREIKEL